MRVGDVQVLSRSEVILGYIKRKREQIGTWKPFEKTGDCGTHTAAKKRDCETLEIQRPLRGLLFHSGHYDSNSGF